MADRTQRIRRWLHAVEVFQSHKYLGVGFGNFTLVLANLSPPRSDTYRYPHNIILELLAATGLIGCSLFVITLLISIIVIHRTVHRDDRWLFLIAYPLFILLSSMFTGDIYDFRGSGLSRS